MRRKNWSKEDDGYWRHRKEDLDVGVKSDGGGGWDYDIYVDGNILPMGNYEKKANALDEAHDFMERNKTSVPMEELRGEQEEYRE
jgi:hypothetical protein